MALTKVQTNAIADDAVTTDKLANAINTERTANTAKVSLADNSVTLAKMAGGTDGQIITYDASGDPVAVGPGTDGQVLTSTGAGSPPAFETLPTSGATLSGSTNNTVVTVTGSNAMTGEANLTFTGSSLTVTNDSGASEVTLVTPSNTDGGVYFNDGSNQGAVTYLHTDDSMKFRVNGTNKMQIDSTGNVGINDTDPSYKLNVAGDNTASNGSGMLKGIIGVQNNTTAFGSSPTAGISFQTKYRSSPDVPLDVAAIWGGKENTSDADKDGYLGFAVMEEGGSGTYERMRIHSNGAVTKPKQPSFRAQNLGNTTGSVNLSSGNQIFYAEQWDTTSSYDTSNGKFTAPVAGKYYFWSDLIYNDASATTHAIYWKVNGTRIVDQHFASIGGQWDGTTYIAVLDMAVGDYMEFEHSAAAAHGGTWSQLGGWLIH